MTIRAILLFLLVSAGAHAAAMSDNEDFVWLNGLKQAHFGARDIIESSDVIALEAPPRAEDAALVPLRIRARMAQSEARYIKTLWLFIDQNPAPLAGRFDLTPKSGRADLALRVRVNAYTPIRAIAETSDGTLYMAKQFVKASGGCSAPASSDLDSALTRLGKMKFKSREVLLNEPTFAQLNISHPNSSGLQMDQVTRLYLPAHFVKEVKIRFNGEPVLTAQTDISISEDPSLGFYFVPDQAGELQVDVVDSKAATFSATFPVTPKPDS